MRKRRNGNAGPPPETRRCAIYTRKSTSIGLDQDFNTLDAQRESCERYIKAQAHDGWKLIKEQYDDGCDRYPLVLVRDSRSGRGYGWLGETSLRCRSLLRGCWPHERAG